MTPRRATTLLPMLVAALLAGCGGDAEAENAYVDAVSASQRSYAARFQAIVKRLEPENSVEQDRATLGAFSTATGRFVVALKAIAPPESVGAEHAALTRRLVEHRATLDRAREALRTGPAARRQAVRAALTEEVGRTQEGVTKAIAEINRVLQA